MWPSLSRFQRKSNLAPFPPAPTPPKPPRRNLEEAAWQLYVDRETKGSFRCARCGVMQDEGKAGFWINNTLIFGDSLKTIREQSQSLNRYSSKWCEVCFAKLLQQAPGKPFDLPVRPHYVAPTEEEKAEAKRERDEEVRQAREWSYAENTAKGNLLWAARTRVLTSEETEKLRGMGEGIFIRFNGRCSGAYNSNDLETRFNALLLHQAQLRNLHALSIIDKLKEEAAKPDPPSYGHSANDGAKWGQQYARKKLAQDLLDIYEKKDTSNDGASA